MERSAEPDMKRATVEAISSPAGAAEPALARPEPVEGPGRRRSASEGLEPAAPSLPAQAWTGDRGEASREPRPARPRALHV